MGICSSSESNTPPTKHGNFYSWSSVLPPSFIIPFFFCNRPALSSDKALGFTTRSLHQCCRVQYSHPIYRVAEKANPDLCLQRIPMHDSAAGTAMPKQPKSSGS